MQHLKLVLEVLRKNELYANKKCNFARAQVEYLEHIISGEGVEVDLEKIRAIKEWPVPTNVREVVLPRPDWVLSKVCAILRINSSSLDSITQTWGT